MVEDDYEEVSNPIVDAVGRVERAIDRKWSTASWVFACFIAFGVFSWMDDIVHSKWRYRTEYDVRDNQLVIDQKPHDCDFLAAPLGKKYCDYERKVSTVRWARDKETGKPIVSYDEGKTWSYFEPDSGENVPLRNTVVRVSVTWKKKDDE